MKKESKINIFGWKKVLAITLVVKLIIFLIIIFAYVKLPFNLPMRYGNFLDSDYKKISVLSSFMTWDSQHYLFLSDHGYRPDQESDRFYPLFPGLIHLGSTFFHNSFWGGIVISNIISLFAILLFYAFVKKHFDEKVAFFSSLFLLAFPTGFYLSLIYSEGLFLLLTLCFFWFLYKEEYFVAGLFSFFLPLTRPVGIFITVPFAIVLLFSVWKKAAKNNMQLFKLLHVLWPFAGLCALFLFMNAKTGYAFETFLLDKMVAGQWNAFNIFNPLIFLKSLFTFPLALHGFTNSIIDRVFFISFLISLPFLYRSVPKSLFFYAILMGGVPLFGSFMSYTRYLFMAFPIFILLGKLFIEKKNRFFLYSLLGLFIILQIVFIILHSLNYWVS